VRDAVHIIAEVKRSSPSAGEICPGIEAAAVARVYESSGAAAVSVLTEPRHFCGSLDDLRTVSAAVSLPVLRKDFIVDHHQVNEAAVVGAEAVLLIAAILDRKELMALRELAEETLGMDALVEVHSEAEMKLARECGSRLIGVNNRNLATLEVDLGTSRALARYSDSSTTLISESGLRSGREIRQLRALGYSAFLVGEFLMRSANPGDQLRSLIEGAGRG
jgi:indole-3-glycerol phosphate synthase